MAENDDQYNTTKVNGKPTADKQNDCELKEDEVTVNMVKNIILNCKKNSRIFTR